MKSWQYSLGQGRGQLCVEACVLGEDVLVRATGGQEHIGSVAIALPRPSRRDSQQNGATASVYNFLGHQDDQLAQPLAQELAKATRRKVVVVAGFHLDDITPAEMAEVREHLRSALLCLQRDIEPAPAFACPDWEI